MRPVHAADGTLVGYVTVARRQRAVRPGWERLSEPGDKCATRWRHESGWEVRHIGHPTALWPYYAVDPEATGIPTVAATGRGWPRLADAVAAVEDVLSGWATVRALPDGVRRRQVVEHLEGRDA